MPNRHKDLTESLKDIALDMGVAKVGIAGRENLAGPPEADPEPILPGAWRRLMRTKY